jgi:hypothetical protein
MGYIWIGMISSKSCQTIKEPAQSFDLFRLTKSKQAVDISANTIRKFARQGLRIYRHGRAAFVSRTELAEFIRNPSAFQIKEAA